MDAEHSASARTISKKEAPPQSASPGSARRSRRLFVLLVLGAMAIGAGLAVRKSSWARERSLKHLNVDELKLAALDSPNDPLTLSYLGSALMADGDFQGSATAFEHAARLDPGNARTRLGQGAALFRMGRLKDASEAFQAAIKLDPKLPDAYLGLSQVYYLAGSPKRAIEPMKKMTELQPNNAVAWYSLGQMYGDAHQSDLALDALTRATQLDPGKGDYWRSLGRVSQHYSKLQDAEQQYLKALRLNQNDSVAYLWLGQLYMQMGDTPKLRGSAEASLYRAVSRQPDMSEAHFALGQLYERRAIWDMAANCYQKAYDSNPSDDQALYHLGLCKVKLGNAAEGNKLIAASHELGTVGREIQNLENRSVTEPLNRDLKLRLARLYRRYGNDEGAKQKYMDYQRMGAADPAVEKEMREYRDQLQKKAEAAMRKARGRQSGAAPAPAPVSAPHP